MNPDAYISREMAADWLLVTPDTIGKWRARGWRCPVTGQKRHLRTKPGPGNTLRYRVGDLADCERDTRNSRRGRRGTSSHLFAVLEPTSPPGHPIAEDLDDLPMAA